MATKQKIIFLSLGMLLIPVVVCIYFLVAADTPINDYRLMFEGVLLGGWVVVEVVVLVLVSLYYSYRGAPPPRQPGLLKPTDYDPEYAKRQREIARYFHLAAGLVLLVGTSICFGAIGLTQ